MTRPEALAAHGASRFPAQVAAQLPSDVTKALHHPNHYNHAQLPHAKPESRRNLKPTKPAVQISDVDRERKILITNKCTMTFKKWREKGESFRVLRRVDRYRCIEGLFLESIFTD
jgi:hypothetical protein